MLNTGVEVDLVWLTDLLQKFLGSVSLLRRKNGISFGGADGVWSFDALELILFNEGGVRRVSDIDLTWLQETDNIFSSETVSDGANFLKEL